MEVENLPKDKKIILFDGICNLCNSSVLFIIKHDEKDVFRFVALQSDLGESIAKHLGIHKTKTNSIILYKPEKTYYLKAEAILQIGKELNSWHRFLPISIFTVKLGNYIYDYISKNRYKWYGKKENCMIPTPELNAKFLF
jgi:predicted DCC family thiol-disulfide oxidoreductase YuxK